jgi:uncharacterized protein (DUF1697 family)
VNTYVALLRGINVGGNAMVSMKDLKAAFERRGLSNVRTYINSGNVIFQSADPDPRRLEALTEPAIEADCGVGCKVVVKSLAEYQRLINAIPKSWSDDDTWRYNVIFLRHTVDSKSVLKQLQPDPEIEELIYCPGAVLWAARKDGITRSRVAKLNRQPLYREVTVRNLNTARKILELMLAAGV